LLKLDTVVDARTVTCPVLLAVKSVTPPERLTTKPVKSLKPFNVEPTVEFCDKDLKNPNASPRSDKESVTFWATLKESEILYTVAMPLRPMPSPTFPTSFAEPLTMLFSHAAVDDVPFLEGLPIFLAVGKIAD
jgi:hypothetical protein